MPKHWIALYRQSFNEICQRVFQSGCIIYTSSSSSNRSPCFRSLSTLLVFSSHFSHFGGRIIVWHCGLVYIFLMTDKIEHLFILFYFWSLGYLVLRSAQVFIHFSVVFFIMICEYALCILDIVPLLDICLLPSMAFLFSLLIFSFDEHFNRVQFISIILLWLVLFCLLEVRRCSFLKSSLFYLSY